MCVFEMFPEAKKLEVLEFHLLCISDPLRMTLTLNEGERGSRWPGRGS